MDAIIDRFQFGRLVDHIFRRRDFTAIMQPSRQMKLVPLLFTKLKFLIFAVFDVTGGLGQHLGDNWHTRTMSPRIGRFRVNGAGNQFDKALQQFALLADKI